jgi:hypothetical protein
MGVRSGETNRSYDDQEIQMKKYFTDENWNSFGGEPSQDSREVLPLFDGGLVGSSHSLERSQLGAAPSQSCYGQQYAESPISNLQGATSTVACGQQLMLSSSDKPPEHLKWLKSFLSLGFSKLLFLKMKDFIGTGEFPLRFQMALLGRSLKWGLQKLCYLIRMDMSWVLKVLPLLNPDSTVLTLVSMTIANARFVSSHLHVFTFASFVSCGR